MDKVYCFCCQKEIKSKENLVTALYMFFVKPYHDSCYSKELKSVQTLFMQNYPINGVTSAFGAIVSPFIGIGLALILKSSSGKNFIVFLPLLALFLIPTFLRLYSYYKFEKFLN